MYVCILSVCLLPSQTLCRMYNYSDSTNHNNRHVVGLIYPRTVGISALSDYVTEKLVRPLTYGYKLSPFFPKAYTLVYSIITDSKINS